MTLVQAPSVTRDAHRCSTGVHPASVVSMGLSVHTAAVWGPGIAGGIKDNANALTRGSALDALS